MVKTKVKQVALLSGYDCGAEFLELPVDVDLAAAKQEYNDWCKANRAGLSLAEWAKESVVSYWGNRIPDQYREWLKKHPYVGFNEWLRKFKGATDGKVEQFWED
jgi:hypothetical protein